MSIFTNIKAGKDYVSIKGGTAFLKLANKVTKGLTLEDAKFLYETRAYEIPCDNGKASIKLASRKEVVKLLHNKYRARKETDMKPTGYWSGYSWMGKLPGGSWMAFSSEEEYLDYLES